MSTVSEIIMSHPEFAPAKPCFVSIYETNKCYGGPEEGGWFYDRTALVGSVPFPTRLAAEAYLAEAESKASALQAEANDGFKRAYLMRYGNAAEVEDDFCVGEVASADEYEVIIEEVQGERDNTREPIPHWE